MTELLIKAAKGWRDMARLVVIVATDDGTGAQELTVKLGESRRRWKRVAATIAPIAEDVLGARGYNDAGELVGSWDAPAEDEDDDDEPRHESDEQAQHRQHTQWVMREMAKVYEGSLRLNIELCRSVIEMMAERRSSGSVSTAANQPTSDDETAKTLQMLLGAFMASQQNRTNTDEPEAKRDTGGPEGGAGGQGPPS